MKTRELNEKTIDELHRFVAEKKNVLRESRFLLASGKVKNNRILLDARKDIARALTLLHTRAGKK